MESRAEPKSLPSNPPVAAWGLSGDLTPLGGGHHATEILRLETGSASYVLKSQTRSEAALRWLQPLWRAAEHVGFIVPRFIPSDFGAYAIDGWTCEPFIEGRRATRSNLTHLASRMEDFHARAPDVPQRPGFCAASDLVSQDTADNADLAGLPIALQSAIRSVFAAAPTAPKHAIHGDLHAGNVLWTPCGTPALIDWDEARVDLRLFDRLNLEPEHHTKYGKLHAAWEIAACWRREPDYAQELASKWFGQVSSAIAETSR